MSKSIFVNTTYKRNRNQAYALIVFGLLCLLGAWLLPLRPTAYPIGLLLFGIGMLIAAYFNPYRLLIGGILITFVGIGIFFAYKPIIPYADGLLIAAIGLGLLFVALAARRGYVGAGAITPGILVFIVGLLRYPPFIRLLPAGYASFILSLWFPGIGLLLLGIIYFLLNWRSSKSFSARIMLRDRKG